MSISSITRGTILVVILLLCEWMKADEWVVNRLADAALHTFPGKRQKSWQRICENSQPLIGRDDCDQREKIERKKKKKRNGKSSIAWYDTL